MSANLLRFAPRACRADDASVLGRGARLAPLVLCAVLSAAACSEEDAGSVVADGATVSDAVFVPDVASADAAADSATAPDTGGADGTTTGDTAAAEDTTPVGPCEGEFGCPCASNADCLDELCVEGADGLVCTQRCISECPDDAFSCLPIAISGADPFNACVPQHPQLCKPCASDADCENALLPSLSGLCLASADPVEGSFCGSPCAGTTCPAGYGCADVPLAGGGVAKQCRPTSGECACRPAWANQGLTTPCAREGAEGSCEGTRTCGVDGLTACDAAAPVGEVCNLVDDDCDGATDEGTCDDGLACTADTCVGAGECASALLGGYCLIDGVCVAEGEANPDAACQRCVTAQSTSAWSAGVGGEACFIGGECYADGAGHPTNPCLVCEADNAGNWTPRAAGAECDDGEACTLGDACGGGVCAGEAYSCDDDSACTVDVCVGDGTCAFEAIEDPVEVCGDGVDNDCDGLTDEGMPEVCGDGVDNDCDGSTDESDDTWGQVFFARPWVTGAGERTVAIYPSAADGSFGAPIPLTFPDERAYGITGVGDLDGDGFLDLIVQTALTGGAAACTGSGQSSCGANHTCVGGACARLCTMGSGPEGDSSVCPTGHACLEVNPLAGDAANRRCMPPVEVLLARERCPDGAIELLPLATLAPGESVAALVDADNNGHLDLIVRRNHRYNDGTTLLNNGDFTFTPRLDAFNSHLSCTWVQGISRTSKDLDGDGVVDLLGYCNPNGGSTPAIFWWWRGHGDGAFGDANGAPTQFGAAHRPVTPVSLLTVNDFDSDGDMDIINGLDDDGTPGLASILLNRGGAAADLWVPAYGIFDVTPGTPSGSDAPGVGTGTSFDFDRDGYPDVLAAWVPEEQCSGAWNCSFGAVAMMRNLTADPCGEGMVCGAGSACVACVASCDGRECGDDGCGGSCGACARGTEVCTSAGQCEARNACVPQCGAATCGDNGCGGACGYCAAGESCVGGQCVSGCVPSCAGKACGDDGCGGRCVIFGEPEVIAVDEQPRAVEAPTNAAPTPPGIAVLPANPGASSDLFCAVVEPSRDLDPVRIEYRWYRNGVFAKEVGDRPVVPSALTSTGQVWECRARATDETEWSPTRSATVVVF